MRLKELREEKKLTQKEVADAVNGTQSNLAKWEKGKIQPVADSIIRLADFFGVSTDYLLGRSDELGYVTVQNSPTLSPEEQELLNHYRVMRPDLRPTLLSTAKTLAQTPDAIAENNHKKIRS